MQLQALNYLLILFRIAQYADSQNIGTEFEVTLSTVMLRAKRAAREQGMTSYKQLAENTQLALDAIPFSGQQLYDRMRWSGDVSEESMNKWRSAFRRHLCYLKCVSFPTLFY